MVQPLREFSSLAFLINQINQGVVMRFFRNSMSLVLAFAIFISSSATASTPMAALWRHEAAVLDALNRFNYGVSVTWDQTDPKHRSMVEQNLVFDLLSLEERGIKKAEIEEIMIRSLHVGRHRTEVVRLIAALRGQNLGPEKTSAIIMQYMRKNSDEGTSFRGIPRMSRRTMVTLTALVVLGAVAYVLIKRQVDRERKKIEDKADSIEQDIRAQIEAEAGRIKEEYLRKIEGESEEIKAQFQVQLNREIERMRREYELQFEQDLARTKEELRVQIQEDVRRELEVLILQCGVNCLPR